MEPPWSSEQEVGLAHDNHKSSHYSTYHIVTSPAARSLHQADPGSLPPLAAECLQFLRSEPFCFLLTHLTGVELVQGGVAGEEGGVSAGPSPTDDDTVVTALCSGGVQRMQPGDYTLVHDSDGDTTQHTLDALLYFRAEGWPQGTACMLS